MPPTSDEFRAASVRSHAVGRGWVASADHRRLQAAFDTADPGDADAVGEVATGLLADAGWLGPLLDPLIAALAADPWFEPPLRVNRNPLRAGAILFDHPAVSLSLSVLSAAALAALPPARTLVVAGRLTVTAYLKGGGATLLRWRAPMVTELVTAAAAGTCQPQLSLRLHDGAVVRHDGRTDAMLITDATGAVVTLTATIRAQAAPVMREYGRGSGAFVRMATLDDGAARSQVLLTLLRELGASGAGDCFDAATRDGAFFLRWSAMREWLAHDAQAGWPRLVEMAASDPHPEVRATAAATLAQFAERRAA